MQTLQVNDLSKQYKKAANYAINHVSFQTEPGRIYGFFGPNGSGKTTTINILSTMLSPTSGDALVMGHSILTEKEQIRSLVGLAPQKQSLNWFLTVIQNIEMFSIVGSKRERYNKIEQLLWEFDLLEHRDNFLDDLSGGQLKRVEIVRCLLNNPKILFIDEPTIGVDPLGAQKIAGYLKKMANNGVTVLVAANDLESIENVLDEVIFIKNGSILSTGGYNDFLNQYCGGVKISIYCKEKVSVASNCLDERLYQIDDKKIVLHIDRTEDLSWALHHVQEVLIREGNVIEKTNIDKPSLREAFINIIGTGVPYEI